tara:strand:- start:342 stop:1067 length:726 start_codon:yes stop_codon:yes gene_type:complete
MANKELTYEEVWKKLSKVDVSKHTEEKMKLTYLSWSRMWNLLMQNYPQAQYEFVDFDGVPYKTLPDGTAEVWTRITIGALVREMRLAVMDYKTNPVVNPHARQVSDNSMRCLVKNVAMFGLGISVFTGMADETLPDEAKDEQPEGKKTPSKKVTPIKAVDPTVENYDLEWADLWTQNAMEWINQHDTREELTEYYETNLKRISVLKSNFPDHSKKLIEFFKARAEEVDEIKSIKEKEQKNV